MVDKDIDVEFCDRVKTVRRFLRQNQKPFALFLGLDSASAISDIERYAKNPSKTVIEGILKKCEVDENWFLRGQDARGRAIDNFTFVKRSDSTLVAEEPGEGYYPEGVRRLNIRGIVERAYWMVAKSAFQKGAELEDAQWASLIGGLSEDLASSVSEKNAMDHVNFLIDQFIEHKKRAGKPSRR